MWQQRTFDLSRLGAPLRAILDAELGLGNKLVERTDFFLPLQLNLHDAFHDAYCRTMRMPGVRYVEERDVRACMWEDTYTHGIYALAAPGIDEQTPADLNERRRFNALLEKARTEGRLLPAGQWRGDTLPPEERAEHVRLCAAQLLAELEAELSRLNLSSAPAGPTDAPRKAPAPGAGRGGWDLLRAADWIRCELLGLLRRAAHERPSGADQDRLNQKLRAMDPQMFAVLAADTTTARLGQVLGHSAHQFGGSA